METTDLLMPVGAPGAATQHSNLDRELGGAPLRTVIVAPDAATVASLEELCARSGNIWIVATSLSTGRAKHVADGCRAEMLILAGASPNYTALECLNAWPPRYRERAVIVLESMTDVASVVSAGAFEILLRPLSADQLLLSTLRLRALHVAGVTGARPRKRTGSMRGVPVENRSVILVGERANRLYPLGPDDIDYVEATGNYVKYHIDASEYIARDSMKRLTTVLRPFGFVRIEKSLLLNISAVAYAECIGTGLFEFTLFSGVRLRCGPSYREGILDVLPLRRRAARGGSDQP